MIDELDRRLSESLLRKQDRRSILIPTLRCPDCGGPILLVEQPPVKK